MGIFRRVFGIGKAKANKAIDALEDPVEMTQQGIRDLEKDISGSRTSLAEVSGIAIRQRKAADQAKTSAKDYGKKAETLLNGGDEATAMKALEKQVEKEEDFKNFNKLAKTQEAQVNKLKANISKLQSIVNEQKTGLVTLKARQKTAEATKKVNKQLAKVDTSGTIAMLERMKEKVEIEESEAEAYGNDIETDDDDAIDAALEATSTTSAQDKLAAMKAKMNK